MEDGAVEFRINLLGELQVEGKCSDLVRMAELADAYVEDEDEFERVIDIMNSLIDIHLYYDCTSTEQASIELEPMMETDEYYGEYYYWAEPVIVFNDGSRYLFYEYFDEEIEANKNRKDVSALRRNGLYHIESYVKEFVL